MILGHSTSSCHIVPKAGGASENVEMKFLTEEVSVQLAGGMRRLVEREGGGGIKGEKLSHD